MATIACPMPDVRKLLSQAGAAGAFQDPKGYLRSAVHRVSEANCMLAKVFAQASISTKLDALHKLERERYQIT